MVTNETSDMENVEIDFQILELAFTKHGRAIYIYSIKYQICTACTASCTYIHIYYYVVVVVVFLWISLLHIIRSSHFNTSFTHTFHVLFPFISSLHYTIIMT